MAPFGLPFFLTQWQELCLSIKMGKGKFMYKQRDSRLGFQTPTSMQSREMHGPKGGGQQLHISECSLPLLYVFLYPCGYLRHRFYLVVENSPISLFPNIPKGVDYYPISSSTFRSWHFPCRLFPPCPDMDGVCLGLLLQLSEVFPREDLIPNRLSKRATKA